MSKCIWLTGLSGSGKSTIANAYHKMFGDCVVVDGDDVRSGVSSDLVMGKSDRSENVRRIAHIAKIIVDSGIMCIVACMSPYAADRANARRVIGADRYVEVYLDVSVHTCIERDPKGLYARHALGEVVGMIGIDEPYQHSTDRIELSGMSVIQSVISIHNVV